MSEFPERPEADFTTRRNRMTWVSTQKPLKCMERCFKCKVILPRCELAKIDGLLYCETCGADKIDDKLHAAREEGL